MDTVRFRAYVYNNNNYYYNHDDIYSAVIYGARSVRTAKSRRAAVYSQLKRFQLTFKMSL